MPRPYPVLTVERPNEVAGVDLLDINAHVKLSIDRAGGQLEINVRISDAEDSSYFQEHDFAMPLEPAPQGAEIELGPGGWDAPLEAALARLRLDVRESSGTSPTFLADLDMLLAAYDKLAYPKREACLCIGDPCRYHALVTEAAETLDALRDNPATVIREHMADELNGLAAMMRDLEHHSKP